MTIVADQQDAALHDRVVAPTGSPSTSQLPTPGHEKIVSVRIAPASSVPTCSPIVGDDRDQRIAQRMHDDHAPARQRPWRARCARSPRAAPRASTSASSARSPRAGSCRARSPAGSGATAPSGTRPCRRRRSASTSMKPVTAGCRTGSAIRPETGVQPRPTEKNRISSSAHQKIGIE